MKEKNIVIVILLLVIAGLLCWTVVQREDRQKDAKFRLIADKAMFEATQRNDLQKVKSSLSIFLLSDVRDYERRFGVPSGTNRFTRDFVEAQAMANDIENRLVPISSIATNSSIVSRFGSNVTIIIEPEK
jgi:hypothetical protein